MDQTPDESVGDLTLVDSLTSQVSLHGTTDFTTARVGFRTFVFGVSTFSATITSVEITSDGTLGRARTVTELANPANPLDGVTDVASARVNLYHHQVGAVLLGGALVYNGAAALGDTYSNESMVEIKTISYLGESFLVTGNAGNNAVSLFYVASDGSVDLLRRVSNGLAPPSVQAPPICK